MDYFLRSLRTQCSFHGSISKHTEVLTHGTMSWPMATWVHSLCFGQHRSSRSRAWCVMSGSLDSLDSLGLREKIQNEKQKAEDGHKVSRYRPEILPYYVLAEE